MSGEAELPPPFVIEQRNEMGALFAAGTGDDK